MADSSRDQRLLSDDGSVHDSKQLGLPDAWKRYIVLGLYSYITANQSLLWMTWSSVPDVSRSYLNVSDNTLDLWLDWGPIAFLCSVFIASWLLSSKRNGLQMSIRIAATLCLVSAVVRCVPIIFSDEDLQGADNSAVLSVIHVCQFLNGAAAPFVVASPSYLSLVWFPEEQRNGATAVANVANALGRGVGFFLGPALVKQTGDMPTLLLVEVGISVIPFIASMLILPPWPSVPPSRAAEDEARRWEEREALEDAKEASLEDGHGDADGLLSKNTDGSLASSAATVYAEVKRAVLTPSFVLLCVAGGLEMAIYGAWSGVLPSVLTGTGKYNDTQAGAFGSVNTFAGIVGGLITGFVTDLAWLRKRLVAVVVLLLLAGTAAFGLVAAALPPFTFSSLSDLTGSYPALLALCGLAGLVRGGTDPLFFELAAESVADRDVLAGTAGAVLTFWYHLILCLLLSVPSAPLQTGAMPAMAACLALAALLLAPVKVAYSRR